LKKIIRENLFFIVLVCIFWALTIPYVYSERDSLYVWYSLKVSNLGYQPKVLKKFQDKGDKILANLFDESVPKTNEEWFQKIGSHLDTYTQICNYSKELGEKDEILAYPTWFEKNEKWAVGESKIVPNNFNRNQLPNTIDPLSQWKDHHEQLLEALDYYKRGLNYSGPEFIIAKKIHKLGNAVCRSQEGILAYSTFIFNTENYAENELQKDKEFKREMRGKTEKQKFMHTLALIKSNKKPFIASDYIEGLNLLLKDTGFEKISPIESNTIYEKILYFFSGTLDINQRLKEKEFRLKRGKLLFSLKDNNKKFLDNALLEFSAVAALEQTDEIRKTPLNNYNAIVFEANLYRVRCFIEKEDYKKALKILTQINLDIRKIDDRSGKSEPTKVTDRNLLQDYHLLHRKTLIKMGRKMEADEITFD
jgi:hypothetical protein